MDFILVFLLSHEKCLFNTQLDDTHEYETCSVELLSKQKIITPKRKVIAFVKQLNLRSLMVYFYTQNIKYCVFQCYCTEKISYFSSSHMIDNEICRNYYMNFKRQLAISVNMSKHTSLFACTATNSLKILNAFCCNFFPETQFR